MLEHLKYLNPFYVLQLLTEILEELRLQRTLLEAVHADKLSLVAERRRRLANPITAKSLSESQSTPFLDPDWIEETSNNPYNELEDTIHDEVTLREMGYSTDEIYDMFSDDPLQNIEEENEVFATFPVKEV